MLNLSKNYLSQTRGIDVVKKLILADQYRLTALKVSWLFPSIVALQKKCPDLRKQINTKLFIEIESYLQEVCLRSFTSVDDIVAKIKVCSCYYHYIPRRLKSKQIEHFQKSTEYAKFSSDMKAAICDRIMEI